MNFFRDALHGEAAHVDPLSALEELDWRLAGERPKGSPHTIFQILNHMIFWQNYVLVYFHGKVPDDPEHAEDSWPGEERPIDKADWLNAVSRFADGLQEAEQETEKDLTATGFGEPNVNRAELLATIVTHNSYHTGQIALLRRQLGTWPPPSGGDTW